VASRSAQDLPAWPILAIFLGYPAWWLLGLTPFLPAVGSVVLAAFLVLHRRVSVPSTALLFFAFCLWAAASVTMIDSSDRLIGFIQRYLIYVFAALVLVYVINARRSLPADRLVAAMTVMWGLIVVGGLLALAFPEVRLTTPAALVMPEGLASNDLVHDWIYPPLAEVQTPWGAPAPFERPAAPFPYANSWGNAIALYTPVALSCMLRTRTPWVRRLILLGCFAGALPAAASLNKGMLVGLAVAVVYVAARSFGQGNMRAFAALVTVAGIGAIAAIFGGLVSGILGRQAYSDSTGTRWTLYEETVTRTLKSPLLGYGAPRPSWTREVSVGTQGYMWTLMFSFGFVGLVLFLAFLWSSIIRTWSVLGSADLWLHAVLVVAAVTMVFYGFDTMQLLVVIVVIGLLVRADRAAEPCPDPRGRGEVSVRTVLHA
jgi:hypothetical protein